MAEKNTDFIYLTIPTEYVVVYRRLMQCILEAGIDILQQCDCNCKNNRTRILFDCWCAFQSAIAAKKLGQEKEANIIIKYILANIDLICSCKEDEDIEDICNCQILPIDVSKGILEVISDCEKCNIPTFYINANTGELYSEYNGSDEEVNLDVIDGNLSEIL